jgi:hypothetical protein
MKRSDGLPSAEVPPQVYISSVEQILLTIPGERVMRPTFGSGLKAILFSGVPKSSVESAISSEVRRAINTWEPRVSILDISVQTNGTQIAVHVSLQSSFGPAQTELTFKVN